MEVEVDRTYKIEVIKDDIENGIRGHSDCCPIALAVCRVFERKSEDIEVEVDGSDINFMFEDVQIGYATHKDSELVRKFVERFDKEELVFPFEFSIIPYEKEVEWGE